MISGVHPCCRRDTGPRLRRGWPLIFCLTPRGLACPRLETPRAARISSITPAGRSSGREGAGIDVPATHGADGVHEGKPVGILPGLLGGLVDQASHGAVGEHQPVELLEDEIGRLAAQGGAGPEDVGLDLVMRGLDLPALVVQRRKLGGRRGAMVEKGGGERDGRVASERAAKFLPTWKWA